MGFQASNVMGPCYLAVRDQIIWCDSVPYLFFSPVVMRRTTLFCFSELSRGSRLIYHGCVCVVWGCCCWCICVCAWMLEVTREVHFMRVRFSIHAYVSKRLHGMRWGHAWKSRSLPWPACKIERPWIILILFIKLSDISNLLSSVSTLQFQSILGFKPQPTSHPATRTTAKLFMSWCCVNESGPLWPQLKDTRHVQ